MRTTNLTKTKTTQLARLSFFAATIRLIIGVGIGIADWILTNF